MREIRRGLEQRVKPCAARPARRPALVPEGAPVLTADEIELVPGPGFPGSSRGEAEESKP